MERCESHYNEKKELRGLKKVFLSSFFFYSQNSVHYLGKIQFVIIKRDKKVALLFKDTPHSTPTGGLSIVDKNSFCITICRQNNLLGP